MVARTRVPHRRLGESVGRYIVKRLLQLVPILLGITFLSFALMRLAGSDYVATMLENTGVAVSQEVIDARKAALGLDRPFLEQYVSWLGGMLQGDMGTSYVSGKEVFPSFVSHLPATLLLAFGSVAITLLVSVPLGVYSAVRHDRLADYIVRITCFVGNSLPNFFVALLLIYLFALVLGWFPVISPMPSVGPDGVDLTGLVLPALTLVIAMVSKYTRQIRAAVLEELGKPYVAAARARGVSEPRILLGSVLKSCMLLIVTLLALSMGDLLGGTAIVESIFMWDGVGKLAVDSITMRDYPMIQAYVVWMALIYVVVNLVCDILYCALDPRVKKDGWGAARRGARERVRRCEGKGRGSDAAVERAGKVGSSRDVTAGTDSTCASASAQSAPAARAVDSGYEPAAVACAACAVSPASEAFAPEVPAPEPAAVARRARRSRTAVKLAVLLVLAALLVLCALFAGHLCPWDPYAQDLRSALQPPSAQHLLGTDRYGRDMLSRVILGGQSSIASTLVCVAVVTLVGTTVGVAAGWRGGALDTVLMRVSDVFLAFPGLVFALAVAGVMGGGIQNAVIALAAIGWPKFARIARSQTLAVKESPFIEAARMQGTRGIALVVRHVLPNIAGPVVVCAVLDVATMMMELAGLSYLGLGAQPPMAEWGSMMSDGRSMLQTAPWCVLAPGFAIFVTVLVFNLLGDTLRDYLDPKKKGSA